MGPAKSASELYKIPRLIPQSIALPSDRPPPYSLIHNTMLFTSLLVLATVSLAAAFHVHPNGNPNECLAVDAIAELARVHM